jgi:hypothetical protein
LFNNKRTRRIAVTTPLCAFFNAHMKFKGWLKSAPKEYKTKEIIRFAFIPKNVDGQLIWLEKYKELHVYLETFATDLYEGDKQVLFKYPQWVKIAETTI